MNFELRQRLARVAGRLRSLRFWSGLALCWLAWAAVGFVAMLSASTMGWNTATLWPKLAALAAATAVVWAIVVSRSQRDDRAVARRVESRHPELATLLLAAVEQASLPRVPGQGPTYLQATVIRQALEHGRRHDWPDAVSNEKVWLAKLGQFLALGLLVAVCVVLAGRGGVLARSGSSVLPGFGQSIGDFEVKVDPGNVEIERGTSLLVVAEFASAVPPDARLVVGPALTAEVDRGADPDSTTAVQTVEMMRSLDDPKFVGRLASVAGNLNYHVEFAGGKSDTYRVTVFDYPELVRADAELEFPEYTGLARTVVEDVRHVTAVEGSKLTLICRLNKEVAEARLVDADGKSMELKPDESDKTVYRAGWLLGKSRRLKLQLVDRDGRANRLPTEIVVNVTANRPPRIAIQRPGRDVEVSPLEEMQVKATVADDFGVQQYGMSYFLGGGEPREVTLRKANELQAKPQAVDAKQRDVNYLVDFESLAVEPDQLLSYFVWAEDFGPDGKVRRTMSDMYFAEVRPFDEIYRQGEQPSASEEQRQQQQGEGGAAQEAGELADLQKELINATWKLIRRETGAKLTPEFAADSQLLVESQQSAIEKLVELAQRLEDEESQAHAESAGKHMQEALEHLSAACDGPTVAPLGRALGAEQAASQDLLKLRAREFQVVRRSRQQRGNRAGNPNSRSQRQLDQLELSADENRYETQRRASAPEENQAQRESREILNRLKELARRQDDLNERLRELQSALQLAETPQRRAELERELKRLRDQQQEILRDTDELMSRMDQAQNQQAVQDARQQMEEGRSHVQQASEALAEGQLSQALTEGTRAGRQLSEVRDQFRRQSASRFTEEMSEMRRQARDLDEEQRQLSQQLGEQDQRPGRSLRDTGSRAEAREGLADQRRKLGDLLQRMQETIQEAEEPEPLLARQLYDTVREAHHHRVEDALDVTQRLLEIGVEREAAQAMQAANAGIRNLRQGVERAAESVLGDEAEALRRAQTEVDRLADELNREIEQAQGGSESNAADGPRREQSEQQRQQETGGERRGQQGRSENRQRERSGEQPGRSETGQGESSQSEGQQDQQGAGQQQARGARQGEGQREQETSERDQSIGGRSSRSDDERQERQNGVRSNDERSNGEEQDAQRQSQRGDRGGNANRGGGIERFLEDLSRGGPGGPITGENYRQWSDRVRNVEEMLDDPELRSEAARIRDRAADARVDFKRHSKVPDWTKLQEMVAEPLNELSRRIGEEIRRRQSPDSLVPIDRDPVPPEFSDGVRRYYERLGSGE